MGFQNFRVIGGEDVPRLSAISNSVLNVLVIIDSAAMETVQIQRRTMYPSAMSFLASWTGTGMRTHRFRTSREIGEENNPWCGESRGLFIYQRLVELFYTK